MVDFDLLEKSEDLQSWFFSCSNENKDFILYLKSLIAKSQLADAHELKIKKMRILMERVLGPDAGDIVTKDCLYEVNCFRMRIKRNLERLQFSIPSPATAKPFDQLSMPESSGIYVAWNTKSWKCLYVGKSYCLKARVNKSHERLRENDIVSYSECDVSNLRFCEALTIGVLQPSRNVATP
jgi:hypothetical protein